MDQQPGDQTLVGVSFDSPYRAQEFFLAAQGLHAQGKIRLVDAVTIMKDANGRTLVNETTDPGPARQAMSGAMWVGFLGLVLGGPVGWAAGAAVGAGAGAIRAKVVDIGIPDEWVSWFRDAVRPSTTTIAMLLEDVNRDAFVAEAQRFSGAELLYANFESFTQQRLKDAFGDALEHPEVEVDTSQPEG